MPDFAFTITGRVAGKPATIRWEPEVGFNDLTGETDMAIRLGNKVAATPTGPAYNAGDSPAVVAYLTALSVFDSTNVL